VQLGTVTASIYAAVADGHNGLRVLSLITPDTVPGNSDFTPAPTPRLIGTCHLHEGEVLAVSRGVDRDRVVDETGGQTIVFGRRGSRPFHLDEMERFYRKSTCDKGKNVAGNGELYRVEDVMLSGGVLQTESGTILTPLEMPTPS